MNQHLIIFIDLCSKELTTTGKFNSIHNWLACYLFLVSIFSMMIPLNMKKREIPLRSFIINIKSFRQLKLLKIANIRSNFMNYMMHSCLALKAISHLMMSLRLRLNLWASFLSSRKLTNQISRNYLLKRFLSLAEFLFCFFYQPHVKRVKV